jgi:LysM repeat protein
MADIKVVSKHLIERIKKNYKTELMALKLRNDHVQDLLNTKQK